MNEQISKELQMVAHPVYCNLLRSMLTTFLLRCSATFPLIENTVSTIIQKRTTPARKRSS